MVRVQVTEVLHGVTAALVVEVHPEDCAKMSGDENEDALPML